MITAFVQIYQYPTTATFNQNSTGLLAKLAKTIQQITQYMFG